MRFLHRIDFSRLFGEGLRFIVVGLANTILTFAVYLSLLFVMPYGWAFFVAFIAGLIFQTLMNIRVVFDSSMSFDRIARYVLYASAYFGFNLLILRMLVEVVGMNPFYAPVFMLCVMTP